MVDLPERLRPWLDRLDVPPGMHRLVVGCSGGADSTALLALTVAAGFEVYAVHVDHALRPGSAGEAAVVERAGSLLGCRVSAVTAAVDAGPNLEARAREARLGALEAQRHRVGADAVALGHTADDQAETVLLALLRGSATAGLGAIRPARGRILHPVLSLGRSDTAEICGRLALAPLDDPMNHDPAFRRVWLRREVLPFLEAGAGRDVGALLARQADVLGTESDFLDELAGRELDALGVDPLGERLPVRVAELAPALARRAVRRWLTPPGHHPPPLAAVDAVLRTAAGGPRAVEIASGVRVERVGPDLVRSGLVRSGTVTPDRPEPGHEPGEITVPGGGSACGLRVEAWVERASPGRWPDGQWTCVLDADRAGDRIVVRPAESGDRLAPLGMAGSKRVTTVLAEGGVAPSARAGSPIVTDARGTVLWVVGYRVGAPARVRPSTRRWLWVQAEPTATVGARPA